MERDRKTALELAKDYISRGRPLAWFEELYKMGRDNLSVIPWADLKPNPNLTDFLLKVGNVNDKIKDCLVIGCGLGDDAEYIQSLGFRVEAFDISETAIEMCKKRFPKTMVNYFVDDITQLKSKKKYDFVFEGYTLQVLPINLRKSAIDQLPNLLNTNGRLLIICRGRDDNDDKGNMPWPLSMKEFKSLKHDLKSLSEEDYFDHHEQSPVRRFRLLLSLRSV